jgi:uncharacterized membrane protein SpoIIM required for sporulation
VVRVGGRDRASPPFRPGGPSYARTLSRVDLDAYVAAHQQAWRRLDTLGKRRPRTGTEADELVDLYQEVATHLSVIRSTAPDPQVIGHLSALLARARTRATGTRTTGWAGVVDFFARRFPAALYRTRAWWLTAMLTSYAVTAVMIWWLLDHPQVESALLDPEQVRKLVDNDFAGYYQDSAASHFAAQVWTNNAWVAGMCVAFGILGVPVIYVLFENISNLALIGSIMIRHDRAGLFFGLILPHGLLELTAVFVAAGVGLRLFWAWVAPGDRSRSQSLALEGRSAGGVVMGLAVVLLISGVIEAFVTPSPLPTWARVGIGVLAEAGFLVYVFVPGRRAARAGWTGDIDPALLEDAPLTAA